MNWVIASTDVTPFNSFVMHKQDLCIIASKFCLKCSKCLKSKRRVRTNVLQCQTHPALWLCQVTPLLFSSDTCGWHVSCIKWSHKAWLWVEQSGLTLWCFLFTINYVGFCLCANWQSPNNKLSEGRGEDYHDMTLCQGVLSESWKRDEEWVGFDWWVVWKWVSWHVSSTVVNVSPCTRPLSLRDSHVCVS